MVSSANYRFDLDILKGFCILAVFFYHVGWLQTGYLGVDVFFVINGFLIVPNLLLQTRNRDFSYLEYVMKRVMRLWPLTLLASALVLLIGIWGMLPDDFENLSQAVIASNLFSENILSAITTRNYWDAVNEYKPLMHFWYIGILVEFYVLFPALLLLVRKVSEFLKKEYLEFALYFVWGICIMSLILYFIPQIPTGDKFYYLPFRLFEILSGGLVGYYIKSGKVALFDKKVSSAMFVVLIVLLCSSLYIPQSTGELQPVSGLLETKPIIPQQVMLVLIVFCSLVYLCSRQLYSQGIQNIPTKIVAFWGKMSFSIFVWHQILLAFYRYFFDDKMNILPVLTIFVTVLLLSVLTYWGVEQKIKANWRNFSYSIVLLFLISVPAGWVYLNAGVIRDVPELEVTKQKKHRGMFAEYCDRVYAYDKDFSDNTKLKVLVEGVSFGRDFANILLESRMKDSIEISYIFEHDPQYSKRYQECDYLFTFSRKKDVPKYVWENLNPKAKVLGIGTKNFGTCNGIIYQKRNTATYFNQTVAINSSFYELNELWRKEWGDSNYVDYIKLSTADDGRIRVFTDDHKFISQDCRHLTPAGARWFAQKIDWNIIF